MIYLWVDGDGWKEFELTDAEALKERRISIGDRASIGNKASIGSGASIGDGARIGYGASIGDKASIGDGASIGNKASIGSGARIGYGATPKIIYIIGSNYPVSYWGEDRIDIGCKSLAIDEWLGSRGAAAGIENNFTPEEIEEYRAYAEFIKGVHARGTAGKEEKNERAFTTEGHALNVKCKNDS